MPYNSDSGIISAPVSIDDVKQALGESSNDLATLCKSNNINIWSKHKPIRHNAIFLDNTIRENKDYTNTSALINAPCIVRCGMNIPIDTFKNWKLNFGDDFVGYVCGNAYKDNTFGNNGYNPSGYNTVSGKNFPLGGSESPYRLSDFVGYNKNAKSLFFATNLPELRNLQQFYFDDYPKLLVILYDVADVNKQYNIKLNDIIPDIASNWSFWIQTSYTSHYNTATKVINNRFVANCSNSDNYIYASNTISLPDIKDNDNVTVSPFLAETRNGNLYDTTKIIPIRTSGSIVFSYYPRIAQVDAVKSGSSGFVSNSSLNSITGATLIAQIRIYKNPDASLTITDGMFRSVCNYANKTTYGRGYVSNADGSHIGNVTIPVGSNTQYITIYISFENMYEGGYFGTIANVSYEWQPKDTWTTCYGGGSYKLN